MLDNESHSLIQQSVQPRTVALPSDRKNLEPHVLEVLDFFQAPLNTIEHRYPHFFPVTRPNPLTVPGVESVTSSLLSTKLSFEFEGDETTDPTKPPCSEYLISLSDPRFEYSPEPFLSPQPGTIPPLSPTPTRSFLLELHSLVVSETLLPINAEPITGQLSVYDSRTKTFCSESFDFDLFSHRSTSFTTSSLPAFLAPREDLPLRRVILPIPPRMDPSRFTVLITFKRVLSGDPSKCHDAYDELVEGNDKVLNNLYESSASVTGLFSEILGYSIIPLGQYFDLQSNVTSFDSREGNRDCQTIPLYFVSSLSTNFSEMEGIEIDSIFSSLIDQLKSLSDTNLMDSSRKSKFKLIHSPFSFEFGLWEVEPSSLDRFDSMQRRTPANFKAIELGQEKSSPSRQLFPLGRTWPVSVFTNFFHFVELQFIGINIEGIIASNSARNIAIKVELRSSDTGSSEDNLAYLYSNGNLVSHVFSPVIYHSKSHPLSFFVKVFLPLHLQASHHLYFELFHVSCRQIGKAKQNGLEFGDSVAFGFLPLYLNMCLIESGPRTIELFQTPVINGYLSPNVRDQLKPAFPQRLLKSNRENLGILFKLSVNSSLYPTDSAINLLMRSAAMIFNSNSRVLRIGALLSTSDSCTMVKFFPVLLNILSRALNSSRKSMTISAHPMTPSTPSSAEKEVNLASSLSFKGFSSSLSEELFVSILRVVAAVAVVENGGSLLESFVYRHFHEETNKSILPDPSTVSLYTSLTSEWAKLLAKHEDTGDYSEPALLSLHLSPFLYKLVAKSINLAFLNRQVIITSPIRSLVARIGIATRSFGKTFPNLAKSMSSATSAFIIDILPSLSGNVTELATVYTRFLLKPFTSPLASGAVNTCVLRNLFYKTLMDSSLFFFCPDKKRSDDLLEASHSKISDVNAYLTNILEIFPIAGLPLSGLLDLIKSRDYSKNFVDQLILNFIHTACRIENDASLSEKERQKSALAFSPFLLTLIDNDLYSSMSPLSEAHVFFIIWIFSFLGEQLLTLLLSNINHVSILNILNLFKTNSTKFSIDHCVSIVRDRKFTEDTPEAKANDFAKAIQSTYSGTKPSNKFEVKRSQLHSFSRPGFNTIGHAPPSGLSHQLRTDPKFSQLETINSETEVTPAIRARSQVVSNYASISTALANTGRRRSNSIETGSGALVDGDMPSTRVDSVAPRGSCKFSSRFSMTFRKSIDGFPSSNSDESPIYNDDNWFGGYLSQNYVRVIMNILNIVSMSVSSEKIFPKSEKSSRKNQTAMLVYEIVFEFLNQSLSEYGFFSIFQLLVNLPFRHYSIIFDSNSESKLESLFLHLLKYMNYRALYLQNAAMEVVAVLLEVGFIQSKSNQVKRLLCKSLSTVLSDSSVEIKDNLPQLLDLLVTKTNKAQKWTTLTVRLLKSIITDTFTLKNAQKAGNSDLFTESDLIYRLSISNTDNVDLELSWLEQLASFYIKNSYFSSASLVYVRLATLISPIQKVKSSRDSKRDSQSTLLSLHDLTGLCSTYTCNNFLEEFDMSTVGDEFHRQLNLYLDYVDKATAYSVLAGIGPFINTLFPLRLYLTSQLKKSEVPVILVDWKNSFEKSKNYRQSTFYLVRFKGKAAGDYDNKNYVYQFPPLTKLHAVSPVFTKAFSAPVVVKPGQKIQKQEFRDDTVYVFVTEVTPCKGVGLNPLEISSLDQVCFRRFEFQYPFTKDGSKVSTASPNQIWIKKTHISTHSYLPAPRIRVSVESFTEHELSPVSSAAQGLQQRVASLASAMAKDPMVAQMQIQGSLLAMVNAGPAAIFESFFGEGQPQQDLEELKSSFCDLLEVCCTVLYSNWTYVESLPPNERPQAELFHEALEDGWYKLYDLIGSTVGYKGTMLVRKVNSGR
ncbi:hypothetical protein P9112_008750 [Eukaryota sp. TZLM1-RC]